MWPQVRQLKKARRLSGAVLATLRKRRRSDSASSNGEPDDAPQDGTAVVDGDSDGESGGDAADAELVAEYEQHQCVPMVSGRCFALNLDAFWAYAPV